MNLEISPKTLKKYHKLRKNNPSLSKLIDKTIEQFLENKFHPSLRLHKLESMHGDLWSISVNMKLRILLVQDETSITIVDLGSHDQVY